MLAPQTIPPAPKQEPVSAGALLRGFLLVLVVPTLIFAGVFAYARYEHLSLTAQAPGQPGALVWADGNVIFANKNEIAAWERLHGGNFQAFKKNHPAAVQLVSRPKVARTQTKVAAGKKTPAPARAPKGAEAASPTPGANGGGTSNRTTIYGLGGAALILLLLACAPIAFLWRLPVLGLLRAPELRLLFGGAGAAIAAGLGVSLLLS